MAPWFPVPEGSQNNNKHVLFVVVHARRIPQLRNLVKSIDPKAIMVVIEASEIMGSSRTQEEQRIAKG